MISEPTVTIEAEPYEFTLQPGACALLIIDMQRDFLEPGGFGEMLGNDVGQLRRTIEPNQRLLAAWRAARLAGDPHPRRPSPRSRRSAAGQENPRPQRADASAITGPMGRILIRGEAGHDIIPELYPLAGEPVIDKPGKGAFFATDLHGDPAASRHPPTRRHRRHHRGLRQHHGARSERPRLRLPRARGLRRLVLPGVSGDGPEDDQGAGRHLRLGLAFLETSSPPSR